MFKFHLRQTVHVALMICLILGLYLLPLAASAAPTYAQANAVPMSEAGKQDNNVVILKEVQNPDGTKTFTVRIYAAPNAPNAPDTTFWISQDTYITSGKPDANYAYANNMGIGYNSSGGLGAMRMLLQFNLSSIPSNATVNSATTYIYQYAATGISNMGFQAQYAVTQWSESNATWNNANYIGGATLPIGNFPASLGWLSFNSTNLFQTWVSGAEPNYGLIITGNEDPTSGGSSRWFYSSNSGTARPYVDINYTVGCTYTTPPTSYVNPLPATSPSAFTVSWTGAAYTPPGCAANGISKYIVWYQVNNGGFVKWLDGVSYTSAQFNAAGLGIGNGSVVGFRSQAIDYYNNKTPAGDATAQTTLQTIEPAVSMTPLPTWTGSSSFTVSWTGNAQGGPPISSYNFQVSDNGGATWTTLLGNTPQTSYQYGGGQNGKNYQFRAQASNNGGLSFGPWSLPSNTTIDMTPPSTTMPALPQYTTSTSFWVSWSGSDPGGSGVAYYNVQYQFNGGTWKTLISNTPQTSFYFQNAQTGIYGFRAQAVDYVGNIQAWPADAQTTTTVLVNPLAVVQPFSPPVLQSTASVTKSFTVNWKGYAPPNTYLSTVTVTYRYNSGPWTLWSVFSGAQISGTFTWFGQPGLGDGAYQFRALAANNVGDPPYQVPEAYWQTMIVDMAGKYKLVYLPIITRNAP